MILSSMSVPAILALTLTLPVVDDGHEMEQGGVKLEDGDEYGFGDVGGNYLGDGYDRDGNVDGDDETYGDGDGEGEQYDYDQGQEEADQLIDPQIGEELHHLVDHGFSALHSPLGRIYHAAKSRMNQHVESGDGGEGDLGSGGLSPARSGEEDGYGEEEDLFAAEEEQAIDDEWQEECEQAMEFNKYLVATQCVLGPAFCCFIMFSMFIHLNPLPPFLHLAFMPKKETSLTPPRQSNLLQMGHARILHRRSRGRHSCPLVWQGRDGSTVAFDEMFCRVYLQYGVDCCNCRRSG